MSSRIPRERLLNHPMRAQILELLRSEPGIELQRVKARIQERWGVEGSAFSSIYHHMRLLERFGLVTSRRAGRYRRFYENGGPQGSATTALSVLQNEPLPALANLLVSLPGASQGTLWKRFRESYPCTRQTVGYHLRRLEAHALTRWDRQGAAKNYYPTDTLHRLLPLAVRDGGPSRAVATLNHA